MNIKDSNVSHALLGDPALLETIDQLFACNVGQYINLPQLVVVGDQSSGKSSVLEGLTRLSFPRDSGLCTRFATQIVFRRQAKLRDREITASIIPGNDVNPEDKYKLESWKSSDIQSLDNEGFTKMMQDVSTNLHIKPSLISIWLTWTGPHDYGSFQRHWGWEGYLFKQYPETGDLWP